MEEALQHLPALWVCWVYLPFLALGAGVWAMCRVVPRFTAHPRLCVCVCVALVRGYSGSVDHDLGTAGGNQCERV